MNLVFLMLHLFQQYIYANVCRYCPKQDDAYRYNVCASNILIRPDQINVLVVRFPDPNYPESEF